MTSRLTLPDALPFPPNSLPIASPTLNDFPSALFDLRCNASATC